MIFSTFVGYVYSCCLPLLMEDILGLTSKDHTIETNCSTKLWNQMSYRTALYRFASQNRKIETSQELRDHHFDYITRFENIEYRMKYITLARLCVRIMDSIW